MKYYLQFLFNFQISISELHKQIISKKLQSKSTNKFSPELRTFALTLQFYSSKAYNYVRQTFDKSLSHPSTLRRWFQHIDGCPGFTKEAFDALKVTVSENKKIYKETVCALMKWLYVRIYIGMEK